MCSGYFMPDYFYMPLFGEKLLKEIAQKINELEDRNERREQIRLAQVFAGLRYSGEMIYQIMSGGDMLEESVIVQDWIQRGVQKGIKQGLEEGLEKGREEGLEQGLEQGERKLMTRLITRRFGRLSATVRNQLESLPLRKIEKLSDALPEFKNKEELIAWLNKHSS